MGIFAHTDEYATVYSFMSVTPFDNKNNIRHCIQVKFVNTEQYSCLLVPMLHGIVHYVQCFHACFRVYYVLFYFTLLYLYLQPVAN